MRNYLIFDAFDNPMHLSKVGNWVITFLSPKEELQDIQLAITYVLPRHVSDDLQPRRVIIQSKENREQWLVEHIEYYNSQNRQEITVSSNDPVAQQALKQIIQEFAKYDVNVTLMQA
jgi:hypothetical protein